MNQYLKEHQKRYPIRTIQDDLKWMYQAYLGCEHFVSDFEKTLNYIKKEAHKNESIHVEALNEYFVRVHFGKLSEVEAKVLCRLFMATSKVKHATIDDFKEALLAYQKTLDEEGQMQIKEYISKSCPTLHHSELFREKYQPNYRIVSQPYWQYFDLLCEIEKNPRGIIGIDGRCGSGKSTLANLIGDIYHCPVIHMDDFFLPLELRSQDRLNEPGGNVHYERFKEEVYKPLKEHESLSYGVFDCSQMAISHQRTIEKNDLYVIEGTYAFHPTLIDLYDYKVFLSIDTNLQKQRIIKRNGLRAWENFENKWIPLEEKYFNTYHLETKADYLEKGEK